MNEEELIEFRKTMWMKYCGAMNQKEDPFGNVMTKENFVLHYMMPKNQKGEFIKENLIPLSLESSSAIGNMMSGTVNGCSYKVDKVRDGVGQLFVDGITVSL